MTPAVKRAVEFIRSRVHLHRKQFAIEVGRHLFESIYGGDVEYLGRTGPKDVSIERIAAAPGVEVSANTLRMCIRVYLLVRRHGESCRNLPVPDLPVWAWNGLWDLGDDPESLAAVAAWAGREGIPIPLLTAVAKVAREYTAAGGRLEDLLVGATATGGSPHARLRRMSGVVAGWLSERPSLSPRCRKEALGLVDAIITELSRGRSRRGPRPVPRPTAGEA